MILLHSQIESLNAWSRADRQNKLLYHGLLIFHFLLWNSLAGNNAFDLKMFWVKASDRFEKEKD